MFKPKRFTTDRSIEAGSGKMRNKCSTSGKEFSLHVERRTVKGPPGDFVSLRGINDQNLDTPNLYHAEFVQSDPGDILIVDFEGNILRNAFHPNIPDAAARAELIYFLELYRDREGFNYQGKSILQNILNFRWLRRNNRTYQRRRSITFTTEEFEYCFTLPANKELPTMDEIESDDPEAVTRCIDFIGSRLHQKDIPRWFKVRVEMLVGRGMNLFPSQELDIKKKSEADDKSKKNRQGRTFRKGVDVFTGRKDIPLIDERHILYALYTSDTFYNDDEVSTPINTNPSGFVYDEEKRYRDYAEGTCLYNYQERLDELIKELEKVDSAQKIPGHSHYLVTNYIKGGNFGA